MRKKILQNRIGKKVLMLLATLGLLLPTYSAAQSMANYTVSRTTGNSYNSIEMTGNSIPSWRNTTGGNYNLDDNRSYQIDIGFDFWYWGIRYTQFSVSTNGYIDFSNSTANGGPTTGAYGYQNTAFTNNTNGTLNAIAPFYDDLMTQGGTDPLGESVKYLTTGVAPNRVLTVEWIRMTTYSNTTPALYFQLKIFESSGVIEFNYSSMNSGTMAFTYTNGINAPTQSATPTTAELLLQQTVNTATYNNTQTNNLSAMPATGSRNTFTPPSINAPTGLTFSNIGQLSMQLNWTDNATNEIGYAIYKSDDGGATYNFITQTAANTTSYVMTGLLAGVTYNYRVFAVNEGRLSSTLSGSQATASAGAPYSIASGLWSNTATWSSGTVPGISDNVTISNGHIVTIDMNVGVNSLTVGGGSSGTLLIGNNNTARSVTVYSDIDVKTGAIFRVDAASNTSGHSIFLTGNIYNSGIFDLQTDADSRCVITFNKSGTQSINGNGLTTNFYLITLNMGATQTNILDVFASNFTAPTSNFLTITNGTFNLATGATVTPFTGNVTIPLSGGIRVSNSGAVLNTTGGNITVNGEIRVNSGTLNIGSVAGNNLISSGGTFHFNGGTTKVAGAFMPSSAYVITDFTMNGGTLIVADVGSNNTTYAPFNVSTSGSVFRMYGGTVIIKNEGGTGAQDLGYVVTGLSSSTVLGGTIQFGQSGLTSAGQIMRINTNIPIYNLSVNSTNATAQNISTNTTVLNNVTISEGTLNSNTFDISVGGNWTNSQTFVASTGRVILDGSGSQSISNAAGETFNKLIVNKSSGTVTINNNITVNDSFQLSLGTFDVSASTLTLNGAVSDGGTLLCGTTGTVNYNRSANGQIVFPSNYGNLIFSNFIKILPSSTVGVFGTFTAGTGAGHTITGNTIDFNGPGAQNIPSFQFNNLTLSNAGTKTLQAGADSVLGTLTIGAANTLATGAVTLNVFGIVTNSGIQSGTGALVFRGSSVQILNGGGSFQNVTVNNSNGITVTGNSTMNGTLTLTTGVISTGTDTLTISATGTVTRTAGHINGWLKKNVTTGASVVRTFELGSSTIAVYTPVTFTFGSVTSAGNIAVSSFGNEHPLINTSYLDPTDNVNRYWKIVNSGAFAYSVASKYSAIFTFINPGDLDATTNTGAFRVNVWKGTQWDSTTAGTRTTTTTQATGIDSLGEYVVGVQVTSGAYRTATSGNWNQTATWQRFNGVTWVAAVATPSSADGLITIRTGHTVTVTAAVTIDQTIVESGAQIIINGADLTINAASTNCLLVYGSLILQSANQLANATAARVTIGSNGLYRHARNGGNIPIATWNANSICEITGITNTIPGNLNQSFGHFTWNATGQSATLNLAGALTTVNGNVRIVNVNSQILQLYNAQTTTMNIGGNLSVVIPNGTFQIKSGGGAMIVNVGGHDSVAMAGTFSLTTNGAVTKNVSGNLIVTNGTFNMSAANNISNIINLTGNMVHTGGTITETGTGTASGEINFAGTNVQTFTGGGTVSNFINYTVNTNANLSLGTQLLNGNIFTLSSGGTLQIGDPQGITSAGATGNVRVVGIRTYNTGSNYSYIGSSSQLTGNGLPATVNSLTVNNTTDVTISNSVTVTDSIKLLLGNLSIGTNTLTLNNVSYVTSGTLSSSATGTVNYNKASNGQVVFAMNYGNLIFSNFNKTLSAGTIGIAGTFTPGSATGHTTTGNTINYNGTIAQSIVGWLYYNNLSISGSNWKQSTGNTTVNGNLSVTGATLSDSIYTMTVKGNIVNNSVITGSGSFGITKLSNSVSPHILSGTGRYWILEVNDINGATLSNDLTIDSLLILTTGIVSSGSNNVICNTVPGVQRPGAGGHVNGNMRKNISVSGVPQNYTYEIGGPTSYTPVEITFNSVSVQGTVTVYATPIDHPQLKHSGLDRDKSVNRFYNITGSGVVFTTYDATFNFVTSDIDAGANTAYFFVKRYNNPSWFPSGTNIRLSTSTRLLNIIGFGDFAIGEVSTTFYWTKGAGTFNWGDDYNWSSHSVPTAGNTVYFDEKDTIEVNVNGICEDLILQNDTLRLTIRAGKTLTVNGNLTQHSGVFSTRGAFPTVSGTISLLNNSTFGYDSSGGTQNVSPQSYRNLRISGGGTKTATGVFTVNRNLTIGTGATFADGGNIITVKDSITNNGNHTGSGKIFLNGATQHRLTGIGSYTNLHLDNSSGGITLDSNNTINGLLTLTNGNITAPDDTLFISSTGSIVRTNGFINGNLGRFFAPGSDSLRFDVGTALNYIPVTVAFNSVTTGGNLTLQMISGEHFDIDNSTVNKDSSINRYWILKNNGIAFTSYNITVNWLNSDVDAGITNFSDFIMAIRTSMGVWDELGSGTVTSNSLRGMTGTSFGSFAVGKPLSRTFTSVITGNWSTAATWDLSAVPKRRDSVRIVSPHIVTLVDNRKIAKITINSGAEFADGSNTLDLYGNFLFSGKWSGTGTIRWNENTSDTLSGSGGKVTGTSTLFVNGTGKVVTAINDTLHTIQIAAGITITNKGIVVMTQLIGDNSSSTWVNDQNASINVFNGLLATGTLSATANNNTVIYGGSGAQSVKTTNYHHLHTAVGGTKTLGGNITAKGNIVIGSGSTLQASATTDTVYGNWTNNGTFIPSTSKIVFSGSTGSNITGTTTFNEAALNKTDSTIAVNLSNNIQAVNLAMTKGKMVTGSNAVTLTNGRSGNGVIVGTITRTHAFSANTQYEFESPFNTLNYYNTGTLPSSVTVTVVLDSSAIVNSNMNPINRYYTISQVGGSGTNYNLKLHYEDGELGSGNSETTPPLKVWRDSSGTWVRMGASTNNATENWISKDSVQVYGTFSISSRTITNVVLALAANATNPGPADQVEYTITYNNYGDGPASNFIVMAPVPLNTSYVANSVFVNGVLKTDGSPGVTVGASALTLDLSTILGGAIAPGSSGNVKYKVSIN